MLKINFTSQFLRQLKKLNPSLQDEALEKIEDFKNIKNHEKLKVHKLQGVLSGSFSFSVNYSYRILFEYISKNEVVLFKIGNHEIYN